MPDRGGARYLASLLISLLLLSGCATFGQQAKTPESQPAKVSSNEAASLYAKANEAMSQGKKSDALFYYQEILKSSPNERPALIRCGQIYLDIGLPELAEEQFARVLESNAEDIEALEGRGLSRVKLYKFGPAKVDLQRVSSLDAKRWNAWNGLGVIADMEGDFEQAAANYRKGLDVLPNYPPLINNLGYSLIMAHQYQEAEQVLRGGLVYAPDFVRMKNNLGIALAWQGEYGEALEVISPAIGESVAFNNVGYIAMLREDYSKAIELFEQALQSSPTYYLRAAQNLERARYLQGKKGG